MTNNHGTHHDTVDRINVCRQFGICFFGVNNKWNGDSHFAAKQDAINDIENRMKVGLFPKFD